jgi:ketosteroid isomerase-like protein
MGAFLARVIPLLRSEVVAMENGHPGPRKALWSHEDPVTLFGAEASASGWEAIERIFNRLAQSFSDGQSCTYDVVGAGVSGDLGYVAAIERSVAGTHGSAPETFTLRVTTIFRREQGEWKVVHRPGDPLDALTIGAGISQGYRGCPGGDAAARGPRCFNGPADRRAPLTDDGRAAESARHAWGVY